MTKHSERDHGFFLDGRREPSTGSDWIEVVDPASGEVWARVPDALAEDVDRAVAVARREFERGTWASARPAHRARVLRRLGELLVAEADELARLQVAENGKLLREMRGQLDLMAEYLDYYASLALGPSGKVMPTHLDGMLTYTVREPAGVVAAITPWNSPLLLLVWKLGPALAVGNSVVVKPSESSPVSTLRLAELAHEAGIPAGVLGVVTGGGATGAQLAGHAGVDRVAFTGSTVTGRAIAVASAQKLRRATLELGGKSANIVFADSDLDAAMTGAVAGVFGASGQTCMAGSRVLVEQSEYASFLARLAERADAIRIGSPYDPASEMGTIANAAQLARIEAAVVAAVEAGAELHAGGRREHVAELPNGLFYRPTVLAGVGSDAAIAQEEVFGPVVCVIPFRDEDDAVTIANATPYGLAAGVWTRDLGRALRVSGRLKAGTVWVNNYRKTSYSMPFGGYGASGMGRENGPDALEEFAETKAMWIDAGLGIPDPFNPRAR